MAPLLLRPAEVAVALGISRSSVYALLRNGDLPGIVRIGNRTRICAQALHEWIRDQIEIQLDDEINRV